MDLSFRKRSTVSKSPLWIFPQPTANSIALGVLFFAGTRDENWPKEAGIAHALEHLHFQGTQKFPSSEKITGYIEEVGGWLNASTSKERTFYHVHVPKEHVKRGTEILSQQVNASLFPENKIGIEMKNIIQELRRRNDSPGSFIYKLYTDLVFGNHPLSKDTVGTEESLAAFKRDDFLDFKKRYYNSNNMVFIAAGNVNEQDAMTLFNEFFHFVPGDKNARKAVELANSAAKVKIERKDIEQVHMVLGSPIRSATAGEASLLELFGYMISGGMSFPLFQEVRDKRGLCYEIHGNLVKWTDVPSFEIYVGTDPKRYKEAITAVLEVIQKAKCNKTLLDRAKTLRMGRLALNFENMSDVIRIAATDITVLGKPRGYAQLQAEIEKATIEDMEQVVDKFLSPEKFSRAMLVPQGFQE